MYRSHQSYPKDLGTKGMSQSRGVALQPEFQDETSEKIMANNVYRQVLRTLAEHKSMPFLELTSVCNMQAHKLHDIIRDLESDDYVKVSYRGDISEEIVTLKHKGFGIVSSLSG